MMNHMFLRFLEISVSSALIVLVLFLLTPWISKRYAAKWKYYIWIFLALRLLIPVNAAAVSESAANMVLCLSGQERKQAETGQQDKGITQQKGKGAGGQEEPGHTRLMPEQQNGKVSGAAVMPQYRFTVLLPPQLTAPVFPHAAKNRRNLTLLDVAVILWMAGILVFLGLHFFCYLRYKKQVMKNGTRIQNSHIQKQMQEIWDRMDRKSPGTKDLSETNSIMKKYKMALICDPDAASPMVIGFWHPLLVLPKEQYDVQELFFILKHELIHFKRHDVFVKLLLIMANAVHWFNPLIWMMRREANVDMELSCDERVVQDMDFSVRKAYTETLLSTLSRKLGKNMAMSTQFYGGKQIMKRRFQNILRKTNMKNGRLFLAGTAFVIISLGSLAGCSFAEPLAKNLQASAGGANAADMQASAGDTGTEKIQVTAGGTNTENMQTSTGRADAKNKQASTGGADAKNKQASTGGADAKNMQTSADGADTAQPDAGQSAQMLRKPNQASKNKLVNQVRAQTEETVTGIYYADYDYDGVKEAFLVTEQSEYEQTLWFSSVKEVKQIVSGSLWTGDGNGICKVSEQQKIFTAEASEGGSSSRSYCLYVKDGRVVQAKEAGEGLTHLSGKEFAVFPGAYDRMIDSDGTKTGHTRKAYFVSWDGTQFLEYSGKELTLHELQQYEGADSYIGKVQKMGYAVNEIYGYENGIIHINLSIELGDGAVGYENMTLQAEGRHVFLKTVNKEGSNIVERSSYGGIYEMYGFRHPENTDTSTQSDSVTALAYIRDFDGKALSFDVAEWVNVPSRRASQLGIEDDYMDSGFYVHNKEMAWENYPVAQDCRFIVLNWEASYEPMEISSEKMVSILKQREGTQIPYHLTIQDHEIIQIVEQYIP